MLKKIEDINVFANSCGYFFNACIEEDITVNNGYNCKHPDQEEYKEVNGKRIGKCYCFSCPLFPEAEEEDFNDPSIDNQGYEYEESQYILII